MSCSTPVALTVEAVLMFLGIVLHDRAVATALGNAPHYPAAAPQAILLQHVEQLKVDMYMFRNTGTA